MNRPLAVVVLAGGGGSRLWPLSRQKNPKQFLDIVSPGVSMLRQTCDRLCPSITSTDNLFVIADQNHIDSISDHVPDMPAANLVGEPCGRDSAPAIGLMAALVEKRLGDDAVMIVAPADHVILDEPALLQTLRTAIKTAEDGHLVVLGIPPTGPDTGFGYIQRDKLISDEDPPVFRVAHFREKPNLDTATGYVKSGKFYWNAGMFIATVGVFRSLYKKNLPDMDPALVELAESVGKTSQSETFNRLYPTLEKVSVDYAIIERATDVAVVEARIGWNDIGSFDRLAEVLGHDADDQLNITIGQAIYENARGNLVMSRHKLTAVMGLDNIVVIDTPDALLIVKKNSAGQLKTIVEKMKSNDLGDLL
jgi:mannose-1-phosphate guanylyltransferase